MVLTGEFRCLEFATCRRYDIIKLSPTLFERALLETTMPMTKGTHDTLFDSLLSSNYQF